MTVNHDKDVPHARGRKQGEDAAQFQAPSDNPLVEPDCVSPAVEGYFRIPAVWIGEAPDSGPVILTPAVHHATALRKKLRCGIEVRVQRDGLFLFDFASWPLAPITAIPGYVRPSKSGGWISPPEHHAAEAKAEDIAVFRAQVMNAHQACLITAETVVMQRGAMMGFAVYAGSTYKALELNAPPVYAHDVEDTHTLAWNVLNNTYGIGWKKPQSRRVLELAVVEKSFELLDQILESGDKSLVALVEGAYISACRSRERRFGESVVIGWTVCEQLVSLAWRRMLDHAEKDRMPRDRRLKLSGRDYPASVMVEMLEVNGTIDHDLYKKLELARKARNSWAHDMKTPTERDVYACQQSVSELLRRLLGFPLHLQPGGRGGVPMWPVWFWEKAKASKRRRR